MIFSFSKGEIIFYSSLSAVVIMFIVIYVQWRLELETNQSKVAYIFHFCNVVTMMMFYGVTYISLTLASGPFSESGGIAKILLQSTLYPFPFLLSLYFAAAFVFHRYLRPVKEVKGTNIVIMRRKWRRKNNG